MVVSSLDGAGNLGPLEEEPVPLTIKLSLKKILYTQHSACMCTCRPEEGTRSH